MKVQYVPKEVLAPLFGLAIPETDTARIRDDLPPVVKAFTLAHELYHLKDRSECWIWREIKANMAGAMRHPWGFFCCLYLSLRPDRIKLYIQRLKKGN